MNIRTLACEMAEVVNAFIDKAHRFLYIVTFPGH
jgi:hypothetical protein